MHLIEFIKHRSFLAQPHSGCAHFMIGVAGKRSVQYMTIRLDEDLKLQKKLTKRREKRAARRPRRTPAAEQTAAAS